MPSWMDQVWPFLNAIYEWLFAWQTLVGALVALAAALWTIKVMRFQMRVETDRHHDAQRRKRLAARAQMPDALSELGIFVRASSARLVGNTEVLPLEPTSAIATLKQVIEFIDDKAAERVFELVSWYQVFRARNAHNVPNPAGADFGDRQYDAVLLQAYINSLFDYGRNEAKDVKLEKPSLEEMNDALKNAFTLEHMVKHEKLYECVKSVIVLRHKPSDKYY